MQDLSEKSQRRTTTDLVFDQLHEEIVSLTLLPGTKMSEVEVARRFGVSRQPVHDAFNRLENHDLLLIQPQKATKVRGFSMQRVAQARFVRLAVELEVLRHACTIWDDVRADKLEQNLELQKQALDNVQTERFHALDYQFHELICELSDCLLAYKTIEESKQKVDRLCMLSLGKDEELATVFEDHRQIAEALRNRSVEDASIAARRHFGRLDDTIADIHKAHSEYFE